MLERFVTFFVFFDGLNQPTRVYTTAILIFANNIMLVLEEVNRIKDCIGVRDVGSRYCKKCEPR